MISPYQILLPKQLLDNFLHALLGHNAIIPRITKMIEEARQKYYYPCITKYLERGSQDVKCTFKTNASILSSSKLNYSMVLNGTCITVHRQANLLLFVESGTRKLRKLVESWTKFLFDFKRVLDSTTVLGLGSTPILLL